MMWINVFVFSLITTIISILHIVYDKPAKPEYSFYEFYVENDKLVVLKNRKKVSPEWLVYFSGWVDGDVSGTAQSYTLDSTVVTLSEERYHHGGK